MDGVLIVNKPRLTGGHCAVRTLLQDFGEGIIRRQPQFQSSISRYNKHGMLCCEDARLSSGTCSCADLVELMHAPARPPRRVRNPSSQQSKRGTQSQRRRKGWNLRWIPVSASWRCDSR